MPPRRDKNEVVLKARALRRDMTLPEGLLWRELRKRPNGLKFRRQHPIGLYIVDFYCPAARLVIEVDGEAHGFGDQPGHDARRDDWMFRRGFEIMRIPAKDLLQDLSAVLDQIQWRTMERLPLHHHAARDGSPPHGGAMGRN
ncbi:MAG TPA: DUF559 domain-containing protein [Sphingomicrobium sp.]|jgi:very-short-patch-repair endonuclease|nr:DUF559 domain-containing protein [Sphingomicrobium sp.]